jgi:hypothetical protein
VNDTLAFLFPGLESTLDTYYVVQTAIIHHSQAIWLLVKYVNRVKKILNSNVWQSVNGNF